MTTQNSTEFHSTIEFLSRDCKSKNHINCCREWAGIGVKVICNCECHDKKTVLGRDILYHDSSNGNNVITELNILGESNK